MHVPWDGVLSPDQVRALATARIPIVTTRRIYEAVREALDGTITFRPLEREVLPPGAVEAFGRRPPNYQPAGFSPEYLAAMPSYYRDTGTNIAALFAAGALLVAGTDSGLPAVPQGPSLHRELQALVELGVPAATALKMATSIPARVLAPAPDFGTIAPGQRADLLLIDGDPLVDITATERIAKVWKRGVPVQRVAPR